MQVQTLCQQQTPHLQSNTQTHLDVWHSTLGHDLKFQLRNIGTFSVESLASDSECPWYVPKSVIRKDLQIPTVKEEISRFSSHYAVRLRSHPNELIATLTEPPTHKRLRRYWPNDLLTRF
jgi:hypothetical protein